tara:strand:+ start:2862 stop:4352 length:1491 start_codon:yes stop_codon:yes gene_type:complete
MSGIGNGIRHYNDVKTLTIDGSVNPQHVPATATIAVTAPLSIGNGHTIVLRDGYNNSFTYTFDTSSNSTSSSTIGIQTARLAGAYSVANQIRDSINNSTAPLTASKASSVAEEVLVTHDVTWSRNFGNTTVSGEAVGTGLTANQATDGSGGSGTGFTVSNFSGGKEGIASLKINQTQLVGRGAFSFISSSRKAILESRTGMGTSATPLKFRTPDDWDLSWHHRLGPIWTPESCTGSVKTWLTSQNFQTGTSDFQQVNELTDLSSESNNYVQTTAAQQPLINDPLANHNNFNGIVFDGSNDNLYRNGYGSDYDASASDDFGVFLVLRTSNDANNVQFPLQMASSGQNGSLGISLDTTSSATTLNVITRSGGSNATETYLTAFSHREVQIFFIGRVDGAQTVRVNGNARTAASAVTWEDIAPGGTDSVIGETYSGGTASNHFSGNFLEFIFLAETGSDQVKNDYQKIEGYLAYKYNLVDGLHTSHPYKNEAPRATLSL